MPGKSHRKQEGSKDILILSQPRTSFVDSHALNIGTEVKAALWQASCQCDNQLISYHAPILLIVSVCCTPQVPPIVPRHLQAAVRLQSWLVAVAFGNSFIMVST